MTDSILAEIYTVGIATVRRWRAEGRKARIPAPLNTPEKMPDWWEAMVVQGAYEKSCPAGIEAAADRLAAAMPRDSSGEGSTTAADAELASLLATIQSAGIPDYSDGIKTAQRSVMVADYLLLRAITRDEEKKIGPLQKRLGESQDTLRALQRDRGKIELEARDVLPKEEVRTAMLELHANIVRRFRQGIKFGFHEASELTASRETWDTFADDLVDKICIALTTTDFAAPDDEITPATKSK